MSAKRNITVDIVRGLAMLMVILQHTISGTSTPLQNTFFFNLIWSIQMPLFFIISGYVTRYSKPIANLTDLWKFIERRTVSYLFPWIIWTFVIRGFVCQETIFYDLKFLFWHMDTGYWFLVSLWTIVILYGCVDYIASKISKNLVFSAITHCLFMGCCSSTHSHRAILGHQFSFNQINFILYPTVFMWLSIWTDSVKI